MRKHLYAGSAAGFYSPVNFLQFLERQRGVEKIFLSDSNFPYALEKKVKAVYHLSPQQATVLYNYEESSPGEETSRLAGVTLFGNTRSIGEVERIIDQAEEKYRDSRRA